MLFVSDLSIHCDKTIQSCTLALFFFYNFFCCCLLSVWLIRGCWYELGIVWLFFRRSVVSLVRMAHKNWTDSISKPNASHNWRSTVGILESNSTGIIGHRAPQLQTKLYLTFISLVLLLLSFCFWLLLILFINEMKREFLREIPFFLSVQWERTFRRASVVY